MREDSVVMDCGILWDSNHGTYRHKQQRSCLPISFTFTSCFLLISSISFPVPICLPILSLLLHSFYFLVVICPSACRGPNRCSFSLCYPQYHVPERSRPDPYYALAALRQRRLCDVFRQINSSPPTSIFKELRPHQPLCTPLYPCVPHLKWRPEAEQRPNDLHGSLCLLQLCAMMVYGEVEILCHLFLISILNESLGSILCSFTPREKNIK